MGKCDIRVQNLILATGQPTPLPSGGPANFNFQIANYTNIDSDGFNVTVKRDGEIGESGIFYVSKVPAMTVINYPLEINGVIGGTHEIEIEALYDDLDLSNNKVTGTFIWAGIPNLQTIITNIVPSTVELCQDVRINFRVNNFSYDNVEGTTNIKVLVNNQLTNLGWRKENFKARTYIEQSFTANFMEPGVYKISIVADSLTAVESNENDNTAEARITVKDATRLNNDNPTKPILINQGDVHWYYAQFKEDGKANFYVKPLKESLDVNIEIHKESVRGELIGKSSKGAGQADLIEKKSVQAGVKYYIGISCNSGSGCYSLKCKNYTLDQILSYDEIESYVNSNNLTSIQRDALHRINTYANNEKIKQAICNNQPIIFFFEGAGLNTNTKYNKENGRSEYSIDRYGAISLIIKNNKIIFFTDQASTLPDKPKGTKYDIPTLLDGVYSIAEFLHKSTYPAFNIKNAKVIRYGATEWYNSTSNGINIHVGYNTYKYPNYPAKDGDGSWSNSEGCQLLSMRENVKSDAASSNCLCYDPNGTVCGIYNKFSKSIGLVDSNIFSSTNGSVINKKMNSVSGIVVVDREYLDVNNITLQSLYGKDGLEYVRSGVN
ncbi:hypothetical protein SH1V18_27230 [Vallitalea longa]|uniref:CARDB domain-containing protein n=1 Tax=Vallitalea longa TaxID=2936439 RepID=A0A9W6DG98_9FIRM|nr:hypothetical protein [Vallitalea longa]GKX30243.1 hypothetical protein SH1V18_27230 [Vallitalea longa]